MLNFNYKFHNYEYIRKIEQYFYTKFVRFYIKFLHVKF